jgi:hypothetical protein
VMPGKVPFRTAPSVISRLAPPPCWFAPDPVRRKLKIAADLATA